MDLALTMNHPSSSSAADVLDIMGGSTRKARRHQRDGVAGIDILPIALGRPGAFEVPNVPDVSTVQAMLL